MNILAAEYAYYEMIYDNSTSSNIFLLIMAYAFALPIFGSDSLPQEIHFSYSITVNIMVFALCGLVCLTTAYEWNP